MEDTVPIDEQLLSLIACSKNDEFCRPKRLVAITARRGATGLSAFDRMRAIHTEESDRMPRGFNLKGVFKLVALIAMLERSPNEIGNLFISPLVTLGCDDNNTSASNRMGGAERGRYEVLRRCTIKKSDHTQCGYDRPYYPAVVTG